jgi:hypothetical protein
MENPTQATGVFPGGLILETNTERLRLSANILTMKRLVLDLDGTITRDDPSRSYADKEPNVAVIDPHSPDDFGTLAAQDVKIQADSTG